MSGSQFQPFGGRPLDNDTLRRSLELDGDYLYVTATSALERLRRDLAPPAQRAADGP